MTFDELLNTYDPIDTEYRRKMESDTETEEIAYMVMCDGEALGQELDDNEE